MNLTLLPPLRVVLKISAAVCGGYLLTIVWISWMSQIWPGRLADAMQTGLMLGYAFYVAVMIAAFSQPSWQRAWMVILVPAVVLWGWTQWLS